VQNGSGLLQQVFAATHANPGSRSASLAHVIAPQRGKKQAQVPSTLGPQLQPGRTP
jgi:hypothetical protein